MINYERRYGKNWLGDIKRYDVSWEKPYLSVAPYVIVVFKHVYGVDENGKRTQNYYTEVSASIALGFLLAAVQVSGIICWYNIILINLLSIK